MSPENSQNDPEGNNEPILRTQVAILSTQLAGASKLLRNIAALSTGDHPDRQRFLHLLDNIERSHAMMINAPPMDLPEKVLLILRQLDAMRRTNGFLQSILSANNRKIDIQEEKVFLLQKTVDFLEKEINKWQGVAEEYRAANSQYKKVVENLQGRYRVVTRSMIFALLVSGASLLYGTFAPLFEGNRQRANKVDPLDAISALLDDYRFKDLERDLRLKELSLTIAKEKYLDAVDLANAMLRRDPNDRSAFYLRAEAWQGHANELDQSRKKFVNEDGDADLARAARKEAIADYEIVLGMGIGSPDAGESGASIQKNEYVPKPPIIMERVADLLRREREYSRAIGWYHEAQKANSDSLENPGTQEDMDRQRRLVQKIEECRRARNEGEYLP